MYKEDSGRSKNKLSACFHCGEKCKTETIMFQEKLFCCEGCKLVYELLSQNNLCTYYDFNNSPGISPGDSFFRGKFDYLNQDSVKQKLVQFNDGKRIHISFYIPKMHCSSCIWLLENLQKLNPGIYSSRVDFLKREAFIVFDSSQIKLSQVAELLAQIGYEPQINLVDLDAKPKPRNSKSLILKIGIAGFCFGNIMMLSFPEYFSIGNFYDLKNLNSFFGYLNILLALPVLLYCSSDFFSSAFKSIRKSFLNIDFPISLAIIMTFSRSVFEITSQTGSGYLDSTSGIVFFMLIGRYFQDITYQSLSFDRDYKSFFPVAVTVKSAHGLNPLPITELKIGDEIMIRSNEIIPVDALVNSESALIDYSFVSGESTPVIKEKGDLVYAGGRQISSAVYLRVVKEVSQSYLTKLWNNDIQSQRNQEHEFEMVEKINKHFSLAILILGVISFAYWFNSDLGKAINAITTILIVACPCALLLSSTFTNGNVLRIFGKNKFYLKNADVIEKLAAINQVVFDKTGTITHGSEIKFCGDKLSNYQIGLIKTLASQSSHPLSRKIAAHYQSEVKLEIQEYQEILGNGIQAKINGCFIKMGSENFVKGTQSDSEILGSLVYVSIDTEILGYFALESKFREGFESLARDLKNNYSIKLLSGDNDSERETLKLVFSDSNDMFFNQKPDQKLQYIKKLQEGGAQVLMLGDGLNDAGAFMQSNVGIAISDDTNSFSPGCDAILDGSSFRKLNSFISFSKTTKKIIQLSFAVSLLYNIIGLYFAVQGNLSPVIAAILMPASSISIVLLTTISSSLLAKIKGL